MHAEWQSLLRRALTSTARAPLSLTFGFGYNENSLDVALQELGVSVGTMNQRLATFKARALTDTEQREAYRWAVNAIRGPD